MDNSIIVLEDKGRSYRIFLPDHATDYIQKKVAETGVPYELDMLRDMATRLKPGDLALDVGANIGNHSLYLAAVYGCSVIAFEPNAHLAEALLQSANINNLSEQIKVLVTGVGATPGHAGFAVNRPDNLGAQNLVEGAGDIPVITLDDQSLPGPTKLIKIDVEGMELEVLRGGQQLISRDRPIIYIECAKEAAFRDILSFLEKQDYVMWDTFNATPTHLFLPAETVTVEQHLRHLTTRGGLESYRNTENQNQLRNSLNSASLKYRTVTQQLRETDDRLHTAATETKVAKREADTLRLKVADLEAQLQDSLTKSNTAEREAEALRLEVAELESRFHETFLNIAPSSDAEAGDLVSPSLVAGWILALPVAPQEAARRFVALADRLRTQFPNQALALLRATYELHDSHTAARKLGFALIEVGASEEALNILEPIVDELNRSSREERLLKLARAGDDAATLTTRARRAVRSSLRVATIMDEFTYNGYAPECDLQQLSVANWQTELENFRPELLLIESAWRGLHEEWGSKVGKFSRELQGIIEWCRSRAIPTAFWNKEDPVHFDTFLTTAQKFDLVFTTDVDCIPRYKAALGHDRVHLLPFACQPEIHNPIEIGPRKDAFCFAGAYYVRYPDRTRDLDDFLDKLSEYRPFEIFDRNFGKDHPDYMFPQDYQKYIVGTLLPSEIDRAYKGYTFGINLNSVKNSQSMYARRVYELLASNTRVISNYSRGLRLMFGDLVVSTDSGDEALRRIRKQDELGLTAKLRLAGVRKALSEHTYSHRITQIAHYANIDMADASRLPLITVLAEATTLAEADSLVAQFLRQKITNVRFVLVIPAQIDLSAAEIPSSMFQLTPEEAGRVRLGDLVECDEWLAGFVPGDHYGANYLTDLILATRYSNATVFGKSAYHYAGNDGVRLKDGPTYVPVNQLAARRSVMRGDQTPSVRLDRWLRALPEAVLQDGTMLALDPFGYCEGGALDRDGMEKVSATVDDLPGIKLGLAECDLTARADAMAPARDIEFTVPFTTGASIVAKMPRRTSNKVKWTIESEETCHLVSTLDDEEHVYIYEVADRPLSELSSGDGGIHLHPRVGPGLHVMFVVAWLDAQKQQIGHQMLFANRNHQVTPPEGTKLFRYGIRVRGAGRSLVQGILLGDYHPAPRPVISGSRLLLLTNHYPSDRDLYRNAFVHSRVRAYRELGGVTPDIYRLRPEQDLSWHEFQNIDCMTGSSEQLDLQLSSGHYDHVLVHFLDEAMWRVLERHVDNIRITVWIHGAEVQPWWRRTFNYSTDEALEKAKINSDVRLAFWRGLFSPLRKNLSFVFVSQAFATEVFEDLEVVCPSQQYHIIHNPIDDHLFAFHQKPVEQRGKILSIRPFSSAKYANDLTVKAILELQRCTFFDQLEFRIIGDGPLFEETTAPLAGIPNVTCEKRFLSQPEIAALQREYGVFLNPTRWDSQGVSRDEAMSSGLVPITSRVGAVPEFVDETCGYLAEPEDTEGLVRAVINLWENPDLFLNKSRRAAERVRRQSAKQKVVTAELKVLNEA